MCTLPDRYEDLGPIARGGMSEVRRVRDRLLRAVVAMKISLPEVSRDPSLHQRFLDEARLTAQLHHPAIIGVHDLGELACGRLFFTMEEVRGRTLAEALPTLDLRGRVEILKRAAQGVGHAHSRGLIHRDLKPENIMVAAYEQVRVMDWGLARKLGEADPLLRLDLGPRAGPLTQVGEVLGTLAWMPPEQARGELDRLGPEADVYSLGAILYAMLAGRPPYEGEQAWFDLIHGPPPPLTSGPAALRALAERAMARRPEDRPLDANVLVEQIDAWLRQDQALRVAREAEALLPRLSALGREIEEAEATARALLGGVTASAPVEMKIPAWRAEDRLAELRRAGRLLELELVQRCRGALTIAPDLPEAHALLAARYRARLEEAERRRDPDAAAEFEALLREHDRGEHAAWLQGDGRLTLLTEPRARVTHYTYVARDRRMIAELQGDLGWTPLVGVPLPRGSHLLILEAPGRAPLRYPVLIERGADWDGVPPGSDAPQPIVLPALDAVGPDERVVPAGWFWSGGDPEAPDSAPARRVWLDAFSVRRDPVTHREYLDFLNALRRAGEPVGAWLPIDESTSVPVHYRRDADGSWAFMPDEHGRGSLDSPANLVSWWAARRFAAWEAERTGLPWRLLHDLEWEKAAGGVDHRRQPWGEHLEPTWANIGNSRPGLPAIAPIDGFPADEGPYGVRGMAGNLRDWCGNPYQKDGSTPGGIRVRPEPYEPSPDAFLMVRGGAWSSAPRTVRLAARWADPPGRRHLTVGFRLGRSL